MKVEKDKKNKILVISVIIQFPEGFILKEMVSI